MIEDIFGSNSKLPYETFKERVCTQAKWVFNASEIRKRVHDESKVQVKHIK